MTDIVILGAGGHAKVVADVAHLTGHEVCGYVDEGGRSVGTTIHGAPVVGSIEDLPDAHVALGIGDNRARLARHRALTDAGRLVVTLVHPRAVLARHVELGAGTVVLAGAVINTDTVVGAAVVLNTSCSVDHDSRIGDGVHIAPGCHLAGNVTVGEGAFVGIGSSVVPGRTLGDWCVCGAGSVVVHDVPPGATVKGVPAR